jgi:hypothetical protein
MRRYALIRSDTGKGIRRAFPNFFSDAQDFAGLLTKAMANPSDVDFDD